MLNFYIFGKLQAKMAYNSTFYALINGYELVEALSSLLLIIL